jgi:cyclopropane-fatty-acyl-phospholipid synthase
VLGHPRVLEALVPPASEKHLAEAYLDGDIEAEGDLVALLEAAALWEGPRLRPSLAPALLAILARRAAGWPAKVTGRARRRGRIHSVDRDRRVVRHHYDLSDAFYRLFLDEGMTYSCAWFPTGSESLEEAQRRKLELVCRKLALAPGDRVLDVGCGWGAFLEHAAAHHQVEGLGITLSENQLAEARRRLGQVAAGRVEIRALDYRHAPTDRPFHKVASIGMMEHVGRARLGRYFAAIHRLMAPGGLFLNHAIADAARGRSTLPWASRRGGGFIDGHIFPDGDLVPLPVALEAAERAGFEVRDVESLREHYEQTLLAWLGRLETRFADAEALVGRRRARAYRLYLASSAAAFRVGRISVFQVLLAKRTATGHAEGVPRNRADWHGPVCP